jgi:hypothetical protein
MRWKSFQVVLSLIMIPCCGGGGGDKCLDVICDTPPADQCKDDFTLTEYSADGSCDPATGECQYPSNERHCQSGCQVGRCKAEGDVWGWISVVEMNDTMDWGPGVEAYFTVEPHYRFSLPHHIPLFLQELQESGDCILYSDIRKRAELCDPPCDPDQYCAYEDTYFYCRDLPAHFDVGVLTLGGLKADCQLTPDEFDRYQDYDLPGDLFDQNDVLTAETGGGALDPLSFTTRGVAHLEVADTVINFRRDENIEIAWTPADAETRVMVIMQTGIHDPALPNASLVCDVPDAQGKVEIGASLVNAFLDRHFILQKFSRIVRYTREVQTPYGLEIEFYAGSSRGLELIMP